MWSDGPGLPNPKLTAQQHRNVVPGHDRPGTRVSYSTSRDGLHWSAPGELSGPPRVEGFGWIARGMWIRDGELLTLAISSDGLVFTKLFYLVGGRHFDYPHMLEHEGHLLIAFSGAKQTMEVLRVSLDRLDQLIAEESTK